MATATPGTPNTVAPQLPGLGASIQQNAFATPSSNAAGAVGSAIIGSLGANTKPFNPAAVGSFVPQPAKPSINWNAVTLNGGQQKTSTPNTVNAPLATAPPQFSATSNGTALPATQQPLYDSQGNAIIPSGAPSPINTPPAAPITGNTSTPSGAVVNATTGQTVSQPQASGTTFGGLVGSLANTAQGNAPLGENAAQIASNYGQQIANVGNLGSGAQAGDLTTGTNVVGEGNAAIASLEESNRISALQGAESAALQGNQQQLTAQGQEQSGLQGAAGLAQPSGTYPFVFNPTTGTFTNSGGGMVTPQQAAQAVNSGQMSPDQAQQALSYLGTSSQSQLYSAMQGINPSFNWNQATTNAQVQGQLAPAMANATAQLNNLQQTLQNAPSTIQTPVPALNSLIQSFSGTTGIGAGSSQAIQSAITDARAAMANALGVANNSTPSAYDSYVQTLVPDGATLAQVVSGIQQFNIQMQGKLGAYSSPGATSSSTGSGGSIYNF